MSKCELCGGPRRPGTEIKFCTTQGECLTAYNRAYRKLNLDAIKWRQREWRAKSNSNLPTRKEPMEDRVSLLFSNTDMEAIEASKRKGECRSETIRRLVRAGLDNASQEST